MSKAITPKPPKGGFNTKPLAVEAPLRGLGGKEPKA